MEQSAHSKVESISASSVEAMLLTIGDNGVGEDPRYGDDFSVVKLEIDRLSDTDYPEIARLCKRILQNESKDLRIAGYYLLAKIFTDGISGLLEGIELYYQLIKRFGDDCYPQRASAKSQTIAWLNNNKLSAFVNNIEIDSEADRLTVKQIQVLISALNNEITTLYADTVATWLSLNQWIKKNLPADSVTELKKTTAGSESVETVKVLSSEISSESMFSRSIDDVFLYLRKNGHVKQLIAMSRALKWSEVNLPLNENGKTQIEPPRDVIKFEVESLGVVVGSEEKLLEYESYFMESGCQFYLDLQYLIVKLAHKIDRPDVATLVKVYLTHLVDQMPEILDLTYCDGTQFACDQTRRWLLRKEVVSHQQASPAQNAGHESLENLENIIARVDATGLKIAIDDISRIEAKDRSQAFRLDLAKLELCIGQGRYDIALPLALELEAQVDMYRLHEWDKALALDLWDKLLAILKSNHGGIQADQQKIESVKGKICAVDLGYALRCL
jgi:type VI secretion system protein VasJ